MPDSVEQSTLETEGCQEHRPAFDPKSFLASCSPKLISDWKQGRIYIRPFPTNAQFDAYYRRRKREIAAQKKQAPPSTSQGEPDAEPRSHSVSGQGNPLKRIREAEQPRVVGVGHVHRDQALVFHRRPDNGQPSWMNRSSVADYKRDVKLNTQVPE